MKYINPMDLIGNTPLVYLAKLSKETNCNIFLKLEKYNLTGSSKDRAVQKMVNEALKKKLINENSTIIEPTSGNTGIALASVCAILSLKCIIVMPENANKERVQLIKAYGAKIVFTDKSLKMKGSIDKASQLIKDTPNSFMLSQFDNYDNVLAHYETTAHEIIEDLPEIDGFFSAYGTGGTISGITKALKEYRKDIHCICVTPNSKKHRIDGIYPNIDPDNFISNNIDDTVKISDACAYKMVRDIAKTEGILIGISSGCAIAGTLKYLKQHKMKNIVILCADGGERYTSNELLFLNDSFTKKEISEDINYIFSILFTDSYLDDPIWLKYEISDSCIKYIKSRLLKDATATYKNDPAALSEEEVIQSYPGFFATFVYRIAHIIYVHNKPTIAKAMSEYAHSKTGIDIHPGAEIGSSFTIDHGTGVVIGQTCVIGDNVRIYQGVTLGAINLNDPDSLRNVKRHPTIKNNVIIYAGASILGGETVVGNNCIIGSNVFITSSIDDDKIVTLSSTNYAIKENKSIK